VTPLTPIMAFGPDGLTLGAGTVLAPLEDLNACDTPGAQSEARLCALLSAAYLRPVAPQAIRYICRGAVSWRDGDKAMAVLPQWSRKSWVFITTMSTLSGPEIVKSRSKLVRNFCE
jgi:hypothetical protein